MGGLQGSWPGVQLTAGVRVIKRLSAGCCCELVTLAGAWTETSPLCLGAASAVEAYNAMNGLSSSSSFHLGDEQPLFHLQAARTV